MQSEPKTVTPRSFGVHDRIGIGVGTANPVYYRCISSDATGHVFQRVDQPDITESFTHEDIAKLERSPGYRYDRNWFHPGHAKARLMSSVDRFALIPDAEKPGVIFRHDWCIRFLEKEAAGETSRSDKAMAAVIVTIAAEIAAAQAARIANGRAGSTSVVKAPPCIRTLRQWVLDLQAGGMNPSALRHGYRRCGHDAPQRDPDLEILMRKHAARYASETRATKVGLYKDLCAEVDALNKTRATAGFPPVQPPSSKIFAARIRDLTAYEVVVGRKGLAAARKKFLVVSGGLDIKRPGERIEIDEWCVPLQTLLIKAGIWETLTLDLQQLVARERWWLSVAIDCASRCDDLRRQEPFWRCRWGADALGHGVRVRAHRDRHGLGLHRRRLPQRGAERRRDAVHRAGRPRRDARQGRKGVRVNPHAADQSVYWPLVPQRCGARRLSL